VFLVLGDQAAGAVNLRDQAHPLELISLVWCGHRSSPETVTEDTYRCRKEEMCTADL